MATCMYCGAQVADGTKFCTSCGAALPVEAPTVQAAPDASVQQPYQQPTYQQPQGQPGYQQPQPAAVPVEDSGSVGWAILGFFIPIVGIILFLVWMKSKPQCAKMAIIGAGISIALTVIMRLSGVLG